MRIARRIAIALGLLIAVLGITGLLVLRSQWFQNYVQRTVVTSIEEGTGGKVEIGTFHLDWTRSSAAATDVVMHGTEPAGVAPLLRVARVQVNLRLFTSLHHLWDITYLGIDGPQANVIVYPDGRTNIPTPRRKSASSKSPLETVLDLAIGRLELTGGLVTLAEQKHELNIRGNNLRAQLTYNIFSQDYRGQISLQPIYTVSGRNTPVELTVLLPFTLSRDRIDLHDASLFSARSAIAVNASIQYLKNPKVSAHVAGHIALADFLGPQTPGLPSVVEVNGDANIVDNTIHVTGLRASAFGGEFSGEASLKNSSSYQLRGNLKNLDLANAIRAIGQTRLPFDGLLSGPVNVEGNLNAGLRGVTAQAKLSVAPASQQIPLAGAVTATYAGLTDDLSIQNSVLTLPNSRLSMDGSLRKQWNVALTTTDLEDLFAALPPDSHPPVTLRGGQASFTGKVTGSLTAPSIVGHITANRFRVAGRQFDSFDADASLTKHEVAIQNGSLNRNAMLAHFSGTLGLSDWKPLQSAPIALDGSIQNGDLADLLALAGQPSQDYSGQLGAKVSVTGTLGDPRGATALVVTKGMAHAQPFDRAEAQVNLAAQSITLRSASIQLGPSRINLTGEFQHPRDTYSRGQLRADIQSDRIDLAQFNALQRQWPNTAGTAQLNATVTANWTGQFQLIGVNGKASVRGLQASGQDYGDLTATASTGGPTLSYNLNSNFAGSNIHVDGSTQLTRDYPTMARASFGNLPVQRLLALVNRMDIPLKAQLAGTADFTGTIASPQGSADLTLTNASIYGDAVDRVHLTAQYDHSHGNLQFHLDKTNVDVARFKTLTERQPGLTGSVQISASGVAEIRTAEPRILLRDLNGDLITSGLANKGKSIGDLTLAVHTSGGRTSFTLNSGIAGANIQGRGDVQLANDYPVDAQLTVKNATWAGLGPLLGYQAAEGRGFEAVGDAQVSLNGPLMNADQLRGSIQVTRLELSGAASAFRKTNTMVLQSQGPIAATLSRGAIEIQTAHLAGPQVDLQATGTVPLNGQAMNLAINGNINLAILQQFDQSITSSGNIALAAGVRGSTSNPRLTGQAELHNAAFDYIGLPMGISKANGIIALNGNSAMIRNLTAEAGGGQIAVTGSATLNGELRFGLQAKASRVRVQIQQGVGGVASANIGLAGTPDSSSLSGTVTVEQVSYAAKSDLGSLLSLASPPVQTPSTPWPVFENMRLDVRVRSSNALGVQSSVAQNVELSSDLRVRGSVAHPGVLGRVLITEGKLVFFGSTYTVNSGTIAFYNPVRIEPILDLSLETKTRGVDVVLRVTGPIDNMKLSYTSDPPLQFQEIVSLLATGATPTSDPTLLANSPQLAPQNFQQVGESAIVGRALADPVTNQLQRVFGVTQLKVNPAFTSGSQLPEAQLTLQQQISNNITFTYVTGLNTANAETIQAVWTFTPQWSAQALRDYNGIFSVTLIYKKQIR